MIFRDHRSVGLSLEAGKLSVVQCLHRKGDASVEKSFWMDLPDGTVEEQARLLKDRWMKEQIVGEHLVLTFPQSKAIIKTLVLPTRQEREIREMIRLQASRQTPLGTDEIVVDYQLLEGAAEGHSRVAMIVVRKEDINELLAPFQAAGLYPSRLVMDSFLSLPLILRSAARIGWTLVIECRRETAALGLFKENNLYSIRCIPLASLDQEIERTLTTVPSSVSSSEIAVLRESLRPESASWPALAAGHVFPSDPVRMNLLSEKEHRRGTNSSRRRKTATMMSWSVLLACILIGTMAQKFHAKEIMLNGLIQACAVTAPQANKLQRMESIINRAKGLTGDEGSFVHILSELNRFMPARVSLRSMSYESNRMLSLDGT